MIPRVLLTLLAVFAVAIGCNRPGGPVVPVTPPGGATPAAGDYRTMSKPQLQDFIKSKIGVEEVSLTDKGANAYSGTLRHLDGTILPVEVTVEAHRIVCETKTPAASTRQTITPQGTTSDLNVK
jgi:hypothetical protein